MPLVEGYLHWLFYWTTQWIAWLQTAPAVYASPDVAIAATVTGDLVWVDEKSNLWPGELEASYATNGKAAGTDVVDIAVSGSHVYYVESGTSIAYGATRAAPGTVAFTMTKTNPGTNRRIVTDGQYVLLCYDVYVECFNATTGASVWVVDHGAAVHDACFGDDGNVYMVGALGTTNYHVRRLTRATGALLTGYRHSAAAGTLVACCWANGLLYVAGAVSDYASGATIRGLTNTLAAATTEGGATASARAWNQVQADAQTTPGTLQSDGRLLYCGLPASAAVHLEGRSLYSGAIANSGDATIVLAGGEGVASIACDHGTIVLGVDAVTGKVLGVDPATFEIAWCYTHSAARTIKGVATDGTRAWAGLVIGAAENGLLKLPRAGSGVKAFRRMDYSNGADTAWSGPSALRRLLLAVE
jgi:hypothetical protein